MTDHLTIADLENRTGGDRITIPEGWEKPADGWYLVPRARDIGPGWALTHDGGDDRMPWRITAPESSSCRGFAIAKDVEGLRIPRSAADWIDDVVDVPVIEDDEPTSEHSQPPKTFGHVHAVINDKDTPERILSPEDTERLVQGASEILPRPARRSGDQLREAYSHVHVEFDGAPFIGGGEAPADAPEADDDGAPLRQCADDECTCNPSEDDDLVPVETKSHQAVRDLIATDQRPILDEWQLERVASLEHALRVLESRRAPENRSTRMFGVPVEVTGRPTVSVADLLRVATFIADGTTGAGASA